MNAKMLLHVYVVLFKQNHYNSGIAHLELLDLQRGDTPLRRPTATFLERHRMEQHSPLDGTKYGTPDRFWIGKHSEQQLFSDQK